MLVVAMKTPEVLAALQAHTRAGSVAARHRGCCPIATRTRRTYQRRVLVMVSSMAIAEGHAVSSVVADDAAGAPRPDHRREPAVPVRSARLAGSAHARSGRLSRVDHLPEGQGLREELRGDRRHRDLPASAAVRRQRRARLPRRVQLGAARRVRAVAARAGRARLRRDPRVQSARHDVPDRRLLQAVRQEVPVRSPRHQSRAVRGEVPAPRRVLPSHARLERWTFKTADVCVATNESYRRIAIERGERSPAQGVRRAQRPRSAPPARVAARRPR